MDEKMMPIIQVGDVLVSSEIFTECFCCDLEHCHGICCVEGDAGAPVTIDEVALLEQSLDAAWPLLSARAQTVIDRQGVVYTDGDGDLVTSIVDGRDCVFTHHQDGCCLCALEMACREGRTSWPKPISCALYPIREKKLSGGLTGLNYNRWTVCREAVALGQKLRLPLYKFLSEPLKRRFGDEWYEELLLVAEQLKKM